LVSPENSLIVGDCLGDAAILSSSLAGDLSNVISQLEMLKAHHEMRAMGLRERFSFAPDRDDVRIRLGSRVG
jgi:hypothetical protein